MSYDYIDTLIELAEGVYVDRDVLRVVDAIRSYDPNLRVKYLDPNSGAELVDAPYKIMELCPDGIERVIFSVWSLDNRVLDRLYSADTHKHDILAGIDVNNSKAKEDQKRRFRDEQLLPAHDVATHVLASPKTTYTVPGPEGTRMVFDSHLPTRIKTRTGLEVVQVQKE